MLISVCIPSIRPDTLGDAIASILRQRHDDWELIVVGQGDEHALRTAVAEAAAGDPRVRHVHLERLGTSAARNRGAEEAKGDVIAFMDDDCEAADDWMPEIVAAFDRHPGAGIVAGSLVKPAPGPGRFKVCPEMIPLEVLHDPAVTGSEAPDGFGWAGANMTVRRRVVDGRRPVGRAAGTGNQVRLDGGHRLHHPCRGGGDVHVLHAGRRDAPHARLPLRLARAAYRLLRNYATGNGALAAKLTLLGDPRGRAWMRNEVQVALVEPIKRLRPQWLPRRLVRLGYYAAAYRSCRRTCSVSDREIASAVLKPAAVRAR